MACSGPNHVPSPAAESPNSSSGTYHSQYGLKNQYNCTVFNDRSSTVSRVKIKKLSLNLNYGKANIYYSFFNMKLTGKQIVASSLSTTGKLCTLSFGKNILIEQI
jgi:hypothetical protein